MSESTNTPEEAPEEAPKEELSILESFKVLLGASRSYWLVNQVNFLDGVAYFGILNLLILFISRDIGFTDKWAAVATSFFTGGVTLFMFGGGFVTDKFGVRKALSICLVALLIGRILLVQSAAIGGTAGGATLWTSLLIMAIATGILQPTLYAGVKEFTDPRTATIGFGMLYSIMNLGIALESWVSPFLREGAGGKDAAGGISKVYWALVAVTGLMLLLHLSLFTKKVEARDRVVVPKQEEEKLTLKERLARLPILDRRFQFFIFVLLPVRTLFAHQFMTIPEYVLRCFPKEVGARYEWFQGLNPAIIVVFVPLVAALTRKVHVVKMMIVGTAVSAVTTFMLVAEPSVPLLITYVVLFSFGEAIWSSRFLEYVADIAPPGQVGAYMGIAGIPWWLAKATTGLYSGFMINRYIPKEGPQDPGTMWLIYGLIACISPIGLILGRRWLQKR